jgi:6 kDa early secretory antigenic target
MADGVLVVQFAQLQAASGHIAAALNAIHTQLDDLEKAAGPLVNTWGGDARAAYDARQTKWRNAANDLSNILTDIKKAVDESVADYINTEQKNTHRFT